MLSRSPDIKVPSLVTSLAPTLGLRGLGQACHHLPPRARHRHRHHPRRPPAWQFPRHCRRRRRRSPPVRCCCRCWKSPCLHPAPKSLSQSHGVAVHRWLRPAHACSRGCKQSDSTQVDRTESTVASHAGVDLILLVLVHVPRPVDLNALQPALLSNEPWPVLVRFVRLLDRQPEISAGVDPLALLPSAESAQHSDTLSRFAAPAVEAQRDAPRGTHLMVRVDGLVEAQVQRVLPATAALAGEHELVSA